MTSFVAVFKRELKSYFTTPIAYVFLVVFLFFAGYLPFKNGFFEIRQADLYSFFINMPLLFVFLVPATSMRLWAEERRVGSIELLLTLPITVTQAVLGKFFSAWLFLIIALALTFPMVITVCFLGDPDISLIITGYLGTVLTGRRISFDRLFFLNSQQEPGHQLCSLRCYLCSTCLCRNANHIKLSFNIFTCWSSLSNWKFQFSATL